MRHTHVPIKPSDCAECVALFDGLCPPAEIHELPLAHRLVDAEVRDWLDRKLAFQFAQYAEGSPEWKALKQARHVALDGYTYYLTPAILDALKRAGLLVVAAVEGGA